MRNVTIITGASSGMGAEFARQLTRKYLNEKHGLSDREIWLLARSTEKLEQLKIELEKTEIEAGRKQDSGSRTSVKTVSIDLSGSAGALRFKDLLLRENAAGQINIEMLINNAGYGSYGPFAETPVEVETDMVELNCTSLTGCTGYAVPYLSKGSTVINVSSLAAFMPLGNFAVYGATKAYVLSFTLALAAELAPKGIKVSALCPGSVSTNFANVASNGARKEVLHGKDPVKVVAHCLKKAARGKKIIMWSAKWRLTAFLSRFVGRYIVAWGTFRFAKRPRKSSL